jgi:hypothetical protein
MIRSTRIYRGLEDELDYILFLHPFEYLKGWLKINKNWKKKCASD